jgi:DNA-binding MarR family transcriptional regulator
MTPGPSSSGVSIQLTASQLSQIANSLEGDRGIAGALAGHQSAGFSRLAKVLYCDDRRLSRSLLLGLLALLAFPDDGAWVGNNEIAQRIRLNVSTTHRYISTLLASGLLERDPATRKYRRVQ